MDKITEYLRPKGEINQDTLLIPTKNRDNLSSRMDIIKVNPRIINNRTPEKAIRIFESYQRYKKRNDKEHNLLRPPIKINQNISREDKTICHNLAKWLSQYLFIFLFFSFSHIRMHRILARVRVSIVYK